MLLVTRVLFVHLVKIPPLLAAVPHWIAQVPALLHQADVVMPGVNNHIITIDNVFISSRSSLFRYLQELGSGNALQFLPDLESRLNTGHTNSFGGPGTRSLSSTSGLGLEIVGRGPDQRKT